MGIAAVEELLRVIRAKESQRLHCYLCDAPVSSEIEELLIIRAVVLCPECGEQWDRIKKKSFEREGSKPPHGT